MLRRFLLPCLLLACGAVSAADPSFPPGSRIGLVPPADWVPAEGVSGFRNPRTGAGIMLIEMAPDAYPSLAAGFTDEALKAQGFTVRLRDTPALPSGPGLLVSGEQSDGSRTLRKSILLAADATMTALAVAQVPADSPPAEAAAIDTALRTVAFRPPLGMAEQLASLPFQIGDRAEFRPVRAMGGAALLLTDGPSDVIKEAEQPIVIVAKSFAPPPAAESREAFARAALVANTSLQETVLERSQSFRQGGADWHEIVAKAKDGQSGNPVIVMQTIRFDPGSYLRMVGIVRADQRDLMLPRFRRVVDSVRSRD